MKTINLAEEAAGDIKYKISHFPDGQQDIVIDTKFLGEEEETGLLQKIYENGKFYNLTTLTEVRARLAEVI